MILKRFQLLLLLLVSLYYYYYYYYYKQCSKEYSALRVGSYWLFRNHVQEFRSRAGESERKVDARRLEPADPVSTTDSKTLQTSLLAKIFYPGQVKV